MRGTRRKERINLQCDEERKRDQTAVGTPFYVYVASFVQLAYSRLIVDSM